MAIPRELVRDFALVFGLRVMPQIVYLTLLYVVIVVPAVIFADISPLYLIGTLVGYLAYQAQSDGEALYVDHHGAPALRQVLRDEYQRRGLRVPKNLIEEGTHG